MNIFCFSALQKTVLLLSVSTLSLFACTTPHATAPSVLLKAQGQAAPLLRSQFVTTATVPATRLQGTLSQAQEYSDLISKRRDLDLFKLYPEILGLKINDHSYILSFLGTATTRNDLNVELRALVGQNTGMNLNYSGPVTRSTVAERVAHDSPKAQPLLSTSSEESLRFELITGLPPEHITRTYGLQLERLARHLSYRFQAKTMVFDDGPLIYALTTAQDQLMGFVFFNQRNLLTLGERKYADVQSVMLIDTRGQVQGAYTLAAFNPKTDLANPSLNYTIETPENLGQLALLGKF